jgi:hypothetical protein
MCKRRLIDKGQQALLKGQGVPAPDVEDKRDANRTS